MSAPTSRCSLISRTLCCPLVSDATVPTRDCVNPIGLPPRNKYRGDVTFCTKSGEYLFATTRSNHFDVTGYITAFKLGPHGEIERQLFINPTSTSGGHSNAVSPCDFSDEWLA